MEIGQINTILTVYTWFPLAALLAILLMIGRFFKGLTGVNTRYVLFLVPILAFALATGLRASVGETLGLPLADALLLVGGSVLIWLCLALYRQMTNGR